MLGVYMVVAATHPNAVPFCLWEGEMSPVPNVDNHSSVTLSLLVLVCALLLHGLGP